MWGRRERGRTCTREQALRKTTEIMWAGPAELLSLGWVGTGLAFVICHGFLRLLLVTRHLISGTGCLSFNLINHPADSAVIGQ